MVPDGTIIVHLVEVILIRYRIVCFRIVINRCPVIGSTRILPDARRSLFSLLFVDVCSPGINRGCQQFIISYPCKVRQAVSKEKKPIPGFVKRLMKR
jgi:hypothetical protein